MCLLHTTALGSDSAKQRLNQLKLIMNNHNPNTIVMPSAGTAISDSNDPAIDVNAASSTSSSVQPLLSATAEWNLADIPDDVIHVVFEFLVGPQFRNPHERRNLLLVNRSFYQAASSFPHLFITGSFDPPEKRNHADGLSFTDTTSWILFAHSQLKSNEDPNFENVFYPHD